MNYYQLTVKIVCWLAVFAILAGCQSKESTGTEMQRIALPDYASYAEDVSFMEAYIDIIQLSDSAGRGKVAVSSALQGRVMTSTASGENGRSYGWINRELFKSQDTLEHINVFGGEERFWIGPEGGQFSIFFTKGSEFTLDNWYTPKLIDLEPFAIEAVTSNAVTFSKKATLVNYSGFTFDFGITRKVSVLSTQEIVKEFGLNSKTELNTVAYQTTNSLTNVGNEDWKKETGLLSIWLLGMFNPSPETTVVIPYLTGDEEALGVPVNDDYFGRVPEERLIVKESTIYFKGDGAYRSKIGLSPKRAKDVLGSYDASSQKLTIVKYNKPDGALAYVNSLWELQENPYSGDVVNSYNDGAPEPGKKPLGPFYELETSSPALELKVGEQGTHIQITAHFEGNPEELSRISEQVLGVSITEINSVFNVE